MSVSNGQPVSAEIVNAAFVSRTEDTSTVGKLALQNSSPESGAFVANPQQAINETFDVVGIGGLGDPNAKNYTSTNVIANGMDRREAIEALDSEIGSINSTIADYPTHTHDGIGTPQISAANLIDINPLQASWQADTYTGASGLSVDISILFAGKNDGLGGTVPGVISLAPYNRSLLFDPVTGTSFEDTDGTKVYGRISFSTPTWTLTFYTNKAGVETAYSFAAPTDIQFFFLEVFTLATRPTVTSSPEFGSFDVTADVVDATASERGVVNTTTQTFAGAKTFNDNIIAGQDIVPDTDNTGSLGTNTTRFNGVWADFVSAVSSFGLRDPSTLEAIFTCNQVQKTLDSTIYYGVWMASPQVLSAGVRDSFGFRGRNINNTGTHNLVMFTGDANVAGNSGKALMASGAAAGNSGNVELLVGTAGGTQGDFRFHKLGTTTTVGHVWTASSTDGKGYWAAPSAAGANTTLSNLTSPTAINQNLLPDTPNTKSIGANGQGFQNVYGQTLYTDAVTLMQNFTSNRGFARWQSSANMPDAADPLSTEDTVGIDAPNVRVGLSTGNASGVSLSKNIFLGTGNTVNGNSGNIVLRAGVPTGTGTRGKVSILANSLDMNGKNVIGVADPLSAQDAATKNYVDSNVSGSVKRYKYNFSYNDLTAASTTFNIPLKALDPEEMVERVLINVTTPFVGATTLTLSVGNDSGSEPEKYSTPFELVGATDYFMSQTFGLESFTSLLSTKLYFICDVNVNTLTAGALEVYIWTSKG